jgi:hypothetical protein
VHNLVAAAQREHEIVSARAVVALKRAKARGKRLGNPRLSQSRRDAVVVNMERADLDPEKVWPVIEEIQESGVKSLRGIARALAARFGGDKSDYRKQSLPTNSDIALPAVELHPLAVLARNDTEPVCLISCSHRSPEGGCGAGEGRHGAMKPAERARGQTHESLHSDSQA